MNLKEMKTEQRNPLTENIDALDTLSILKLMNQEDYKILKAIESQLDQIAQAVDVIAPALKSGARLIYIGAGTSGRLGVLDASECPPTFGTDPSQIVGLIAGGDYALRNAVEDVEDNSLQGRADLVAVNLCKEDVVVGIAASGRTPYVLGAIQYAKETGCQTIGVMCNDIAPLKDAVHIPITVVVGPEVVTGSTRLKAGTAQKLVLNMLTTVSMIKNGKVFKNLMVDVQATNIKLIERKKMIVMDATGSDRDTAQKILEDTSGNVKLSIVILLSGASLADAQSALNASQGNVREALKALI
ncbi:N-acetylmuramic acid 6-phosphate etherase [Fusibacter bizertensis]